jgi:hypothetical protein
VGLIVDGQSELLCYAVPAPDVVPAGLTMGVPPDQLLALGRQDYVVRSVRMDTKAETWNATFSKLYLIPAGAPGSIKDFLHEGRPAPAAPAGPGRGF